MMLKKTRMQLWLLVVIFLIGCGERDDLAPIEELKWHPFSLNQKIYTVKKGDTLYAVAFKYDKDFRELATANHLKRPYTLTIGQTLLLQSSEKIKKNVKRRQLTTKKSSQIVLKPRLSSINKKNKAPSWIWPIKGRITESYVPQHHKKGINIAGKKGDKIRAAEKGIVAYCGDGLSGYGNLIIIKHNNHYLTAYGYNAKNLVKEGQQVKPGQVIADMGMINRKYWGVHFEIRKAGKPVNPLNYLDKG